MSRAWPRLRRRADRRSLLFTGVALALLAAPHAWAPPSWLAPAWVAAASFACFIASIVNHNQMHCAAFTTRLPNVAFNVALALARGHSASGIVVPHNLNHHAQAGREGDWIRPQLAGRGLGWARLARYVVAASANMLVMRLRAGAPRLPADLRSSLLAEKAALAAAIVLAAWHDPRTFALFNALPWLAGLALLVGVNLLQHDACDPASELGGSRNFTGGFGNWLFFNNGYHTAHHLQPGAHWSELPALHARLRGRLPRAELEQPSILAYLWRFGFSRAAGR
jgi:fatty acid desaturase